MLNVAGWWGVTGGGTGVGGPRGGGAKRVLNILSSTQ